MRIRDVAVIVLTAAIGPELFQRVLNAVSREIDEADEARAYRIADIVCGRLERDRNVDRAMRGREK